MVNGVVFVCFGWRQRYCYAVISAAHVVFKTVGLTGDRVEDEVNEDGEGHRHYDRGYYEFDGDGTTIIF